MADTLTTTTTVSTIPSGSIIATDDAGAAGHVQVVKLALSADGSATAITADANGLEVQGAGVAGTPAGGVVTVQGVASGTVLPVGDGAGTLTVDAPVGTPVYVRLSDGAAAIATLPVSAASLPLPSGAATLTEQQTQTTALQLIDDAVYTDGVGTPSKALGIAGTDGTNPQIVKTDAAGELQVDVLTLPNVTIGAAIPAGTNNIGDVDVLTLPAVTNAGTFPVQVDGAALTALQLIDDVVKVEDDPHATGDKGVMALAVRKDTGAALAGLDADYSPLQVDASGNLRVNVAAGGAGDGAILDGVSSSIKATVLDFVNSNPLAVRLTDTNGDYVGAGAGTQYTEDAASAADPVGTQLISRRRDTLSATEVSLDGDVIAVNASNKGELYVKHVDTIPVTDNGGSLTVDGSVSVTGAVDTELPAAAALADAASAAPTTPTVGAIGLVMNATTADRQRAVINALDSVGTGIAAAGLVGQLDDVATGAVTENQFAPVRISTRRALLVEGVASGTAVPISAASLPLPTGAATLAEQQTQTTALQLLDDTVATDGAAAPTKGVMLAGTDGTNAQTVKVDTAGELQVDVLTLPALVAGTANIGDVDVLTVPAPLSTTGGGTEATALRVTLASDSTGLVSVDDNGGSLTVDGTVTASNTAGDVASDAVDSGNPVKVGAIAKSADITAVADADRVHLVASLLGKLLTLPYATPAKTWSYAAAAGGLVTTTGVTAKAAAGVGIRNYITRVQAINSHQTTGTEVVVRDGAAGAVLWRGWAQAAGGGCAAVFDPPLRGTANTLVEIAEITATATAGVLLSLQGYEAAE